MLDHEATVIFSKSWPKCLFHRLSETVNPGSSSLPFFHVSSHNQGEAQGDTLLICNPGYSTQTLTHLPLAFNWKPQCTGVIMAKQVPYVHTGPAQSDSNEHAHTHTLRLQSADEYKACRCTHINTSHSLKHMRVHTQTLYFVWMNTQAHTM